MLPVGRKGQSSVTVLASNMRNNYSTATCRERGNLRVVRTYSHCLSLVFILHCYAVFTQLRAVRVNLGLPPHRNKLVVIPEDVLCGASYLH